ncbi:SDR family NAD(P)-dependent oxidoreductase [Chitinophagaceae bacterium LB-8]|uniref:SDR family NAD(P)-dependent oxidoreductase n=1 Tax=Paraflavisolibacter caeni TaxID=2982496 RepID=A0A9X2XVP2_9BACT|nr:SDR family NAD(P)-dependent oxidoreductase [Paraflavisolibacter caeni]MCU7549700.1 SDR family NAD(P)-dependent oxidoreductase [Paraflavisolibacter caeni]
MQQKKIIVVGATSGIGKEISILYARQNHLIGITGRRKELLKEIQSQFPQNIQIACFDVMDQDNRKHIDGLIHQLGGLDLIIYNAGYGNPSAELNWETEEITTRTNVNGFVAIVYHCFQYFVQQGYGQIALTSSIGALRGNSLAPAYSASKAYMSNYAEGLNIKAERLKKQIVITDIKPGFLGTKTVKVPGHFWVAPPRKAARQIIRAIEKKKRVVYITKRWWLIAQILKILPFWVYKRLA